MVRPSKLTDEQKAIVEANLSLFPSQIARLPGMEGRTKTEIGNYLYKFKRETSSEIDSKQLAKDIKRYIDAYGLPFKFNGDNGVIGFIKYLER